MAKYPVLDALEKRFDKALQQQSRDALSEVYDLLSCKAIAREIKAGRNVTENAAFGIRICVHDKVGPRYNPTTKKFTPMSAKAKKIEEKFVENVNYLLETGGYKKLSPNIIPHLRKKDKEFEQRVKKRR